LKHGADIFKCLLNLNLHGVLHSVISLLILHQAYRFARLVSHHVASPCMVILFFPCFLYDLPYGDSRGGEF
jgi:hypothetical protein